MATRVLIGFPHGEPHRISPWRAPSGGGAGRGAGWGSLSPVVSPSPCGDVILPPSPPPSPYKSSILICQGGVWA